MDFCKTDWYTGEDPTRNSKTLMWKICTYILELKGIQRLWKSKTELFLKWKFHIEMEKIRHLCLVCEKIIEAEPYPRIYCTCGTGRRMEYACKWCLRYYTNTFDYRIHIKECNTCPLCDDIFYKPIHLIYHLFPDLFKFRDNNFKIDICAEKSHNLTP